MQNRGLRDKMDHFGRDKTLDLILRAWFCWLGEWQEMWMNTPGIANGASKVRSTQGTNGSNNHLRTYGTLGH